MLNEVVQFIITITCFTWYYTVLSCVLSVVCAKKFADNFLHRAMMCKLFWNIWLDKTFIKAVNSTYYQHAKTLQTLPFGHATFVKGSLLKEKKLLKNVQQLINTEGRFHFK
jgi:hypothetical protein